MTYLIPIIILMLAIPIGFFLKYLTKEEIKSGRKYFKWLYLSSLLLAFIILLFPIEKNLKDSSFFALIFIAITTYISWRE